VHKSRCRRRLASQWGRFDCWREVIYVHGENQVPYPYLPGQLTAIRAAISEPRFATYLTKAGNHQEYAVALYLYNARVAKAFLYPLGRGSQLRNAVDEILVQRFGQNWHQDTAFRDQTLDAGRAGHLDKAIRRAGQQAPRGQIVATLTFDFWSNLFSPRIRSFGVPR